MLKFTYRTVLTPGTNEARDYLNLLKPATPNILIVLHEEAKLHVS